MNKQEHLFTILGEEAAELAVQCSKANRFGLHSKTGVALSCQERLIDEYNDVLAVVEMLNEAFEVGFVRDQARIDAKKAKVTQYMAESTALGLLSDRVG